MWRFILFFPICFFAWEKELKGIVLLSDPHHVKRWGTEEVYGIVSNGVFVPGGISKLQDAIFPSLQEEIINQTLLSSLEESIMQYYRKQNYPVVTVQIPPQEIQNGVVQVLILESKVGKITIRGNDWFSTGLLEDYLDLKSGDRIHSGILLNNIAFSDRNPFRRSDIVFTPGLEPMTTDLELLVQDRLPFRIYVGVDDTGTIATGKNRYFGGLTWGNVFYIDHIFTFQATIDANLNRFYAQTGHYTAPLPWEHILILYGGYSHVSPDMDAFSGNGNSYQLSLRYEIPIKPFYEEVLQAFTWGGDWKHTNNNLGFEGTNSDLILGTAVNILQLFLGYNYGFETPSKKFKFQAKLYYSPPGQPLPHQSDTAYGALREGAKSHYLYGDFFTSFIYWFAYRFSVSLDTRIQATTASLLPNEQFGLGGYDTVRGYEEREFNADDALCINLELRSPPLSVLQFLFKTRYPDELLFLLFADYGLGYNYNLLPDEPKLGNLISVGPGFRYTVNRYFSARFDWGIKLHKLSFDRSFSEIHFGLLFNY